MNDIYHINGNVYQVEATQTFDDGSLIVTFAPAPKDDEDILRA